MSDDRVLRSAYLTLEDDMLLRKLSAEFGVPKSELIHAALTVQLDEWLRAGDTESIKRAIQDSQRGKGLGMEFREEDETIEAQPDDDNVVSLLTVDIATTCLLIGVGIAGFLFGVNFFKGDTNE